MGIFPRNSINDVKELIKELLMQNSNGNLAIETETSVLGDKSMWSWSSWWEVHNSHPNCLLIFYISAIPTPPPQPKMIHFRKGAWINEKREGERGSSTLPWLHCAGKHWDGRYIILASRKKAFHIIHLCIARDPLQ